MRKLFLSIACLAVIIGCNTSNSGNSNYKYISEKEYLDAVYASWLGQIVGNSLGLCYEFKYIDNPGPNQFPYPYTFTLDNIKKYNGAFSDDDTDIEYMYLIEMEKKGIEPTYFDLAEAWKKHVKQRVWFANRMAVSLMHAGHYPPVTGSSKFNHEWFQIDPQLVNEIWAVTAPGMINYAVAKSDFAARITNDSFGIDPTLHYAAMYSSAFFEKDINKLIDIGTSNLPAGSRFAKIVEHVKQLYQTYPNDWQKARETIKLNYYGTKDYNSHSWPPVDANLNGALGILALLYGQGDFQKTLDYACAMGMDADNQAATMCGLIGIINGSKCIPHELTSPVKDVKWDKPFNDFYKMITREGLEDANISDMAKRMAKIGEKIILAHGGDTILQNGEKYYKINQLATFEPPFELNPIPVLECEVNNAFSYPLYTGHKTGEVTISTSGNIPPGITVSPNEIHGKPTEPGLYQFEVTALTNNQKKSISITFKVHSKNLASQATKVIFNTNAIDSDIEIIRDGSFAKTYYSTKKGNKRETDFYGYLWSEPQEISAITYNNGQSQEFGGWFTSFDVEYLEGDNWKKVPKITISPNINLDNTQWLKITFMNFNISFQPVVTKGIRIIGLSGGIEKDAANASLGIQYYTSISELKVYNR